MTRCFLQVSNSPLSPLQLQNLAQPPTRSGQSICSAPPLPTYSSLLAHPYAHLSTTPCAYTEVLHSVALNSVFQVKPTCFTVSAYSFCVTAPKPMVLSNRTDDDSLNHSKSFVKQNKFTYLIKTLNLIRNTEMRYAKYYV